MNAPLPADDASVLGFMDALYERAEEPGGWEGALQERAETLDLMPTNPPAANLHQNRSGQAELVGLLNRLGLTVRARPLGAGNE